MAGIFSSKGACVIDADKIARRFLKKRTPSYKKIATIFGKGILRPDKRIDRKKLGEAVFGRKSRLRALNNIIHPPVIRLIKKKIANFQRRVVVLDAPLLIEAGLGALVDKLIVVKLRREVQLKRLMKKTAMSKKDILRTKV